MKILLVDDDSLVLDVIQGGLESLGYTVAGRAADGRKAIQLSQSLEPDLILMDVEMPEMDGIAATKEIMSISPRPIIMLTVYADQETLAKAAKAGAGAYVTKPPDLKALERAMVVAKARVNDIIELNRLNRELKEALAHIRTLKDLLPICAKCKKIRDDQGYWKQIEQYISDHTDTRFSHGLCPECLKIMMSEL